MIPKRLIWFWDGGNMPAIEKLCIRRAMDLHPDYEHVELDRQYLKEIRVWDETCQFAEEYKMWNFLADLSRWEYLTRNGGIAIDTDVYFLRPLHDGPNVLAEDFIVRKRTLQYSPTAHCLDQFVMGFEKHSNLGRTMCVDLSRVGVKDLDENKYDVSKILSFAIERFYTAKIKAEGVELFATREKGNIVSLGFETKAVHLDKYDGDSPNLLKLFIERVLQPNEVKL